MSEEEEYRHVYEFIANHSYPTGFSKNQKRILRRKCQERFCIRSGLLYYACKDQKWIKNKLPDLLKIESELCSPVIHQLIQYQLLGRAYFVHTKEVPMFCICRLPWNKDSTAHIVRGALVQCALRKEWYHQFCCQLMT